MRCGCRRRYCFDPTSPDPHFMYLERGDKCSDVERRGGYGPPLLGKLLWLLTPLRTVEVPD